MRWMHQITTRLRDAPRVLLRWAGSLSHPRSADHELRVSEERFALAVLGAKDGIEAGADEVLKKPLLARELAMSLARVFSRSK